jgi:MscS family membrane protein
VAAADQSLPRQVDNAREQKESHASEKAGASDALGRDTPSGTVFGFLEAARNDRYKEAAQYLQMSRDMRAASGATIARQLYVLMETAFVERVGVISAHVEGSHQIGVPRDRQRIGVFRIDGTDTTVDLVHVPDPTSGDIWLFSSQVVAQVPDLFAQVEGGEAEVGRSHLGVVRRFLNTSTRRFLALILLVPTAFALGWLSARVLRTIVRIFLRWRHTSIIEEALPSFTAPLTLVLAVVFHEIGVYLLGIPVAIRLHHQKVIGSLLVVGIAWFLFRFINVWSNQARARTLESSDFRRGSIILLGQRISKVLVVIVAGLLTLSILGFDITAALAGLGIGSIALAFAAQKTLENLLGGVSVLGDEVIRIGEVCKVGNRQGTVEDISLRSTRIRTVECTLLSVPNGELANMNLENITRRDKSLFHTRMSLRSETTPEQLRALLLKITNLLQQHPRIGSEALRVHLVGFGESSLDIEVNCHILTGNLEEFMAIREDLLLRIMELVAEVGTALAVPSRVLYMPQIEKDEVQGETPNATAQRYRSA